MTAKNKVILVVLVVVGVILLIIVFQNWKPAPFRILFWERSLSPSLVLIVTFLVGAVGGVLACGYHGHRKGKHDSWQ